MLISAFRSFEVLIDGLPCGSSPQKAGTLLLPVLPKLSRSASPRSRSNASRSSMPSFLLSDGAAEARSAQNDQAQAFDSETASPNEKRMKPTGSKASALQAPFSDPLRFAPKPRSVKAPWPVLERALPAVPHFMYDEAWLNSGFPIGKDLPLVRGLQTPSGQRASFGFLEDRRVHDEILEMYLRAAAAGLKLPFPDDATPLELSAVRIPHALQHAGGITILENKSETGLREALPEKSTQVDALLYAWHAYERGRARRDEWTTLLPALTFPEPEGRFLVQSGRKSLLAQTRSMKAPIDAALWRELGLRLARRCGIESVETDWEYTMGTPILFSERADRTSDGSPRLMLSGETLGGDPERGLSYLGLADILNSSGADPKTDLPRIWRRMAFALLCSPDADVPAHWQFVREQWGWRLAPAHAFTIAPPGMASHRPMTIDGRQTLRDADHAVSYAPYFGMSIKDAKAELAQMRRVILGWEKLAYALGADPRECALMAPVLDGV